MPNSWVEFVKKYAKENNISYACAIVPASKVYEKKPKSSKIDEIRKYYPDQLESIVKKLNKYNNENNLQRGKQMARQIISSKSKPEDFIDYMKATRPKIFSLIYE
jgi:arsenate reductase-like glutaredoxin family protein